MQNLDVISFNIWDTLISLANLILLFLIVKKFLYKPVKKVLKARQNEIESQYTNAEDAQKKAYENREKWEKTLSGAKAKADEIIKDATDIAKNRGESIVNDAKERAENIVRQAEQDAILERKKATDTIKKEIVEVSGALTSKMLEREINTDDHRTLIDEFIEKIGESYE